MFKVVWYDYNIISESIYNIYFQIWSSDTKTFLVVTFKLLKYLLKFILLILVSSIVCWVFSQHVSHGTNGCVCESRRICSRDYHISQSQGTAVTWWVVYRAQLVSRVSCQHPDIELGTLSDRGCQKSTSEVWACYLQVNIRILPVSLQYPLTKLYRR